MHAALLYQLTGDPDRTAVDSRLGEGFPAIDATKTEYLDGEVLWHGQAADRVDEERRVPVPTDDGIYMDTDFETRRVVTDWYLDLGAGWAGIDASDGAFFLDRLPRTHGVVAENMELDLARWVHDFVQRDEAYCWGLSYSEGEAEDSVAAGAGFHQDASIDQLRRRANDVAAVGFGYRWDGRIRGVICESGYVALYTDFEPAQFARWLSDEVLDYGVFDASATRQVDLDDAGGESDG